MARHRSSVGGATTDLSYLKLKAVVTTRPADVAAGQATLPNLQIDLGTFDFHTISQASSTDKSVIGARTSRTLLPAARPTAYSPVRLDESHLHKIDLCDPSPRSEKARTQRPATA